MPTIRMFLAMASAEVRSARRLVRTWAFAVLVVIAGLAAYVSGTAIHTMYSAVSSTVGLLNPRFTLAGLSALAVWLPAFAAVFLGFDLFARDHRERVAEVLNWRPMGNLTLLGGRVAGVALVVWCPLFAMLLLVQGLGVLLASLGDGFGAPVDWRSLAIFLFVDAPPTLLLWCSFVVLLAILVRYRLLVILIAVALLGTQAWWTFDMPLRLSQALSGVSLAVQQGSDIHPGDVQGVEWLQRGCQYLLAGGFLCLAATLHDRPDQGARSARLAASVVLVVAAGGGLAGLVAAANHDAGRRTAWAAAHERLLGAPRQDVQRVAGRVAIMPGAELRLALDYTLTVADSAETLVFTLNPGLAVVGLRVDGAAAQFTHENGLLAVPVSSHAARAITLSIVAHGAPDPAFAYLDAAIDVGTLPRHSPLVLMGTQAAVFEERYVALMPGVFWMPMPGVAVGRDDPSRYERDYFLVDLAVQVPDGWLVAGPGRREGQAGDFRFRPGAPVHEVGLLASRFERFAVEAAGVMVEVLVSPAHVESALAFADAAAALEADAREMFATAAALDLPYPYRGLSLVETPAHLRTFGGGWRMASVQALPGMLLLPEWALPTANFSGGVRGTEGAAQRRGGVPRYKADVLRQYFSNDVAGGNHLDGAVRNLVNFQTSARGDGAVALNMLAHALAAQLVTNSRGGFFSPYLHRTQAAWQQSMLDRVSALDGSRVGVFGGAVHAGATRRPSVWAHALRAPLTALRPDQAPEQALNVLWLKVPEVAQAVLDGVGWESVAAFLAELRRRHAGDTFTEQDFNAAAAAVGVDFKTLLGDWLGTAGLPGFIVSPAHVVRVRGDGQGPEHYQIALHVYNDEAVPGPVRLAYDEWQGGEVGRLSVATPPAPVPAKSAVALGVVVAKLPERMTLRTYLSRNRDDLTVGLPEADDVQSVVNEPFVGARPSAWRPEPHMGIVVDDLDAGFFVHVQDAEERGLRLLARGAARNRGANLGHGLPVVGAPSLRGWVREKWSGAHGKYRQTVVLSPSGDGRAQAVFRADLPAKGRWRLAYHLPPVRSRRGYFAREGDKVVSFSKPDLTASRGTYELRVVAAGNATTVAFDASAGEDGWNRVGDFDLPAGEALVRVSNKTSGQEAVADAVRWLPLEHTSTSSL